MSRFHRLLVGLLLVFTLPSHAQESASISELCRSPEFYGSLIQNVGMPTLIAGQRSVLGHAGPAPRSTLRRDGITETLTANLDYRPSAGISRTLRQQISVSFAGSNPMQLSQIGSLLSTDWMWKRFDSLLRGYGYNARNIADVMAAYYVSAWEIIHGTQADRQDSQAARERIAGSLKRSPEIMFMSDAEKQRSAESFGMLTAVATSGGESLRQYQDAGGYIALQQQLHQAFLMQGIDLRKLSLSHEGFVAR